MNDSSRRRAAESRVRQTRTRRTGPIPHAGGAPQNAVRGSPVDDVAFGAFAAYLVLAFTMAFPSQFALPKLLGLYVYGAFAAVRWGIAASRGRIRRLPRALAATTAALAVWWIAATLAAQHLPTAIFGLHGRSNGVATLLAGLAVFGFVATSRLSARQVDLRLGAIVAALTVASLYALVQAAGLDPISWPEGRPASTVGHPVIFAGALAVELPFVVAFALGGRSRVARLASGGAALAQVLALIATLARGPWIAAACGLLVFAAAALARERALARRLAALAVAALLLVSAVLAASEPKRAAVLDRLATFAHLATDSSMGYRLHFCRAALAMLRDHPLLGVGWENFGLLYPRYRSLPTAAVEADLGPTMVHSGPLQTAVSGGVPALLLQLLFLALVGTAVARRRGAESARRPRILGAAFLAALVAYVLQDLSGWPHVALGTLAFAVWGLAIAWSGEPGTAVRAGTRWPLLALALAAALGCGWMAFETWQRMRGERLLFEAQRLDVRSSWVSIDRKLRAAIGVSPDRAWVNDEAARLYGQRAAVARDRRAYERGIELSEAAHAANPFDPYVRLRRAELDRLALDHGLIVRITDGGREALEAAKALAPASGRIQKFEQSLARRTAGSRLAWIEPQASAGFGPPGSLIVAGSAPKALPGTHVFLHWRNLSRGSAWTTQPDAPAPHADGAWYNAIPNADARERYEAYATSETQAIGPCAYGGHGSIALCAPIAFIGPDTEGVGPPGGLLVAGSTPDAWAGRPASLRWRVANRDAAWIVRSLRPEAAGAGVSFPLDSPGSWYTVVPGVRPGEELQAYVSAPPAAFETCTYDGDGVRRYCAPIAWIQPQKLAGFGPPGSLVVAGSSREAWAGLPIFLHWRNATRGSPWTTQTYAPVPDARGTWYNFIPQANLEERYEVLITCPATATNTCTYEGDGSRALCP